MTKTNSTEKLLTASLVLCIAQSFLETLGLIPKNFLNPTNVLELTFILICILNFGPKDSRLAALSVALGTLGISCVLLSKASAVPYFESIRAYKWLLFTILLLTLRHQPRFKSTSVKRIYLTLLASLFLSYVLQVANNGWNSRPILIIENNYECALLIGLYVCNLANSNLSLTREHLFSNLIITSTILMSQSRSALITLLLVQFFIYTRKNTIRKNLMSSLFLLITSLTLALYTFRNRGTNLGNLDRLNFLNLFLDDFGTRSNITKLFGNWIIQPLNTEVCIQLRYYSSLQSNESLGSCYSVVLHSFALRAVSDFGILGAIAIFYTFGKILLSNLEKSSAICFILLAISNSLSVSGVNNVYVVLPMLVALLSSNPKSIKKSIHSFP
jgi:hypothetical protein